MALNVGNLVATLGMDTSGFSTGIAKANTGLTSLGNGFLNLKTLALASTAAIGAALVGVGVVATGMASDFQKSMAEVFTLIPAESEQMYDQLNKQSKEFATTYGVALDDVSSALYQTISAGVEAGDAFEFLGVAQKAAEGGVTDLTTAVDGITSVVNAYGTEVITATEASDLMFTAVRLGKTTFGEMAAQLSDVVPTATAVGVQFGDLTAAIATMTSQGTKTQKATTFLNQALTELSKSGQKGFESFKKASGTTFPEFIAQGGNLSEALQIMENYSQKSGTALIDMFGSVEASKAVLQLTGKGAESFSANLAEMGESAGATETAFERMDETFSKRIDKIKARFEVMGVSIGEAIIPHLETLMDWVDANEEEIIAPLMEAFAGIGEWWDANGQSIFDKITGAFEWLKVTFSPFVEMYVSFWDEQAQKMTDFWNEDGALVMAALENIRKAFQTVVEYIAKAWEWLWPYLENIIGPAVDVILDLVGVFAAIFAGDWDTLKTKLVDLTLDLVDLLWGIFSLGFDVIMTGFEAFANAVLALMTSAWNLLLGGIETMINSAIDMLNGVISAMNAIPGVNIPLIGHVSFERAEAPTVTLPRMEDLTDGKTPSENIREALGLDEAEEEEITPETDEKKALQDQLKMIELQKKVSGDMESRQKALEEAAESQKEAAESIVSASPEPTPVPAVVPTPTEEDTQTSESTAITAVVASDLRSALWEIADNIRTLVSGPILVTPVYPEGLEEEELVPEVPFASITPSIPEQTLIIPVNIDGYEVGRAVYTNWNRRTGGGLNI